MIFRTDWDIKPNEASAVEVVDKTGIEGIVTSTPMTSSCLADFKFSSG